MKTSRMPPRLAQLVRANLHEMRWAIVLAGCGLAGVIATELLAPWPLKVIFDHILLAHPLPPSLALLAPLLAQGTWFALVTMAVSIALIALLAGGFAYLQIYTTARIGHTLTWRLRSALFAHLQQLSLAYHQQERSGELLTNVAGDTNQLRDAFADWALSALANLLMVVSMMTVMFLLNWRLALVVSTSLPPLLWVMYRLNRRVKSSAREQRRHEGAMTTRLNEVLSSIAMIQAFGRGEHEEQRFRKAIEDNLHAGIRSARTSAAISKAIAIISALGTALTVLVGAHFVLSARLTPGELLIFIAYVTALYKPVRDLGKLSAKFSRAAVSVARIGEVFAAEPDVVDAPDAIDLGTPVGEIRFEHVSFTHANGRRVLDDVTFTIRAGEHVGLVGPSGAGKSTVLGLLMRLVEPQAGRILVDGIDIRRVTRESLRRHLGVVPQENMLFAVSVAENIAYGKPEASRDEIERAARLAQAHDFIIDLPDGYDTELGERAATLSGGQRQRLCLARALVKQPAMLLMDEPTASLDAEAASDILAAVAHAHRHKTLLVVTHDTQGLHRLDRVLHLQGGRLVEATARHRDASPAPTPHIALVGVRHA